VASINENFFLRFVFFEAKLMIVSFVFSGTLSRLCKIATVMLSSLRKVKAIFHLKHGLVSDLLLAF